MKYLLTIIFFIFGILIFGQSYNNEIQKASNYIENKDFCNAYKIFEKNLNTKESSYFDYYYGAISATNCNKDENIIIWLTEAKNKGLGLQKGELEYLANDTNFQKIHNSENWKKLIESIKLALAEKEKIEIEQKKAWEKSIINNAILTIKNSNSFPRAKSGYALYFSNVNTEKVPYLVYIPTTYSEKKPSKAIVFLHGGVVSITNYYHDNPEIIKEPIFQYAEANNTIIIYPFAKKDFGWVKQISAFKNVGNITKEVQKKYNINKNKIYLGGMSNGGTAAFWFATQKKMPYKGYFAISSIPKLEIGKINFKNLSRPFYSINSKNDEVFNYEEVKKIYDQNPNKNWYFETTDSGNHGLIYSENGQQILNELLGKLIN